MYDREKAAAYARGEVGWRYHEVGYDANGKYHDGMTPGEVDCSGGVLLAARAGGIELPHQSAQQSKAKGVHTFGPGKREGRFMRDWLRVGDLAFFYGLWPTHWDAISHVAMVIEVLPHRKGHIIMNPTNSARGVEKITLFQYAPPCAYGFIDTIPWEDAA